MELRSVELMPWHRSIRSRAASSARQPTSSTSSAAPIDDAQAALLRVARHILDRDEALELVDRLLQAPEYTRLGADRLEQLVIDTRPDEPLECVAGAGLWRRADAGEPEGAGHHLGVGAAGLVDLLGEHEPVEVGHALRHGLALLAEELLGEPGPALANALVQCVVETFMAGPLRDFLRHHPKRILPRVDAVVAIELAVLDAAALVGSDEPLLEPVVPVDVDVDRRDAHRPIARAAGRGRRNRGGRRRRLPCRRNSARRAGRAPAGRG